jgi:hypothetical protein
VLCSAVRELFRLRAALLLLLHRHQVSHTTVAIAFIDLVSMNVLFNLQLTSSFYAACGFLSSICYVLFFVFLFWETAIPCSVLIGDPVLADPFFFLK